MSLDETLFVGMPGPKQTPLPLAAILEHYAVIRDAMAGTGHVESRDLPTLVANTSFIYAFNAYKAISLLLPELYHESGAAVLRQLWEVSLNLHWLGIDPEPRAQDFCNFTTMECRKLIQRSKDPTPLKDFDDATKRFQSSFRYQDSQGRSRTHGNFARTNIHDRATELGDPWNREYGIFYYLTSMHAHGAPGAVLHAMFQTQYRDPETRENNSASLIAILAIKVMIRNVELLVRLNIIPDADSVKEAFESFKKTLSSRLNPTNPNNKAMKRHGVPPGLIPRIR